MPQSIREEYENAFTEYTGGGGSRSTQLYGLAGEAMLNYGVYGVPVAFAVWGYVIGRIRRRTYNFRPGDLRLFMSGFWLLFGFVMLMADADQYVWFFISLYVIPATLTYLIADKAKMDQGTMQQVDYKDDGYGSHG